MSDADQIARLDVRGLPPPEPMIEVLNLLARLRPGSRLEVQLNREPLFLYDRLDQMGVSHEARQLAADHWEVCLAKPVEPDASITARQ